MSYDIHLSNPPAGSPCGHCGGTGNEPAPYEDYTTLDRWNYTSNCAPMWREAGADLAAFDGQPAGECAPILAAAITAMETDPAKYRAMNPANGWGDYDSLLGALRRLLDGFRSNPHMLVQVWR